MFSSGSSRRIAIPAMPRPDPRQLSLFDPPAARLAAMPGPAALPAPLPCAGVDPDEMDDAALLEAFRGSRFKETERLSDAIGRRRPAGWEEAALLVWDRFTGFAGSGPVPEQRAVLRLARNCAATDLLAHILRRGGGPACLSGDLLCAAAVCGLPVGPQVIRSGLRSKDPELRVAALEIGFRSGIEPAELRPLLSDPDPDVRDRAAVVLAEAGDAVARPSLLLCLKARPSARGLEALALFQDEDALIQLGQLARIHPDRVSGIRALIETFSHPKVGRVLAGLPDAEG
jgi:hypothetical protein